MKERRARSPVGDWRIWALAAGVLIYSFAVMTLVSIRGEIGLRCAFGVQVLKPIDLTQYSWTPMDPKGPPAPEQGDLVVRVKLESGETIEVENYTDYVRSLRAFGGWFQPGVHKVWVSWRPAKSSGAGGAGPGSGAGASGSSESHPQEWTSEALARNRPLESWARSWLWFLLILALFAIGAWVYWKRPEDGSARLFFLLCLVSVGAYSGGYHWSEIVICAPLIYLFAGFALFVPVMSLHFYLVFPKPLLFYLKRKRVVLSVIYGLPTVYLTVLWGAMGYLGWIKRDGGEPVRQALMTIRVLALSYVAIAATIFLICVICLMIRTRLATERREKNQVKWVLWASLLSAPLVGVLLVQAAWDPTFLGRDGAAWLMFAVSILYTFGYAMSITRYKLSRVEDILNRSAAYMAVSVAAGLLYSAFLVISAIAIGEQLLGGSTSRQAMVAGVTAIALLICSGFVRDRFQRAIDRGFHREKYKFDEAMKRMSETVGNLLDRPTTARRLLDAASEVLRLEWGAIYMIDASQSKTAPPLVLTANLGPAPDERTLPSSNSLARALTADPARRVALPRAFVPGDEAADAMIALGGEAAFGLSEGKGTLVGILILGPKRSGMPYEDEEFAFLAALGSVASLALHSAAIQEALTSQNHELRRKVEKIAEQQHRIQVLEREMSASARDAELDRDPDSSSNSALVSASSSAAADPRAGGPLPITAIKGSSPQIKRMLEIASKVAASPSAVLITGESGTGKGLLAETIHALSPRRDGPFVKVHCAALPPTLLESELFGHVRGAFTGADRDRAGRFQQADGGTVFLDEIGDVTLDVQVKLLRVLQEKAFEQVGSSRTVTVDLRILAATNQDLPALIRAGKFREDLFYRLNVISIRTPTLRERKSDIYELSHQFLRVHARRAGKNIAHIEDSAMEALITHSWPGNVRELENVIEGAVVLADGSSLSLDDLTPELFQSPHGGGSMSGSRRRSSILLKTSASKSSILDSDGAGLDADGDDPDAGHRRQLLDAIRKARGNKSEAARLLGVPRSTLFSQMKKHGLA